MKISRKDSHPDDEKLISWMSGNLDQSTTDQIKAHVNSCDKCFLRASVFSKSIRDIQLSTFEAIPKHLLSRGMEAINSSPVTQTVFKSVQTIAGRVLLPSARILEKVGRLLEDGISSMLPRPSVLVLAGSTVAVLVIVTVTLFHLGEEKREGFSLDSFQSGKPVMPLKHQIQPPSKKPDLTHSIPLKAASNKIQVEMRGDSLNITRLSGSSYTIVLASLNGQVLFQRELTGDEYELELDKLALPDTTLVRVTSMGNVIFENLLYNLMLHQVE